MPSRRVLAFFGEWNRLAPPSVDRPRRLPPPARPMRRWIPPRRRQQHLVRPRRSPPTTAAQRPVIRWRSRLA